MLISRFYITFFFFFFEQTFLHYFSLGLLYFKFYKQNFAEIFPMVIHDTRNPGSALVYYDIPIHKI